MKSWLCALGFGLVCSSLIAEDISSEARECFEWFGTLGHPDPKDDPWAEVWLAEWSQSSGAPAVVHTSFGFVLSEKDDTFRVLFPDLTERTLTKTKAGSEETLRVGIELRDFLAMAKARLSELENPPRNRPSRFGAKLGHKTEIFVLAYTCWRKGEPALAQQLYDQASKLQCSIRRDQDRDNVTPPMREALELELGHAAMWDAVLHFGGGSLNGNLWGGGGMLVPRAELLEKFRQIVRLYPRSEQVERAKKTIQILERMVKEDADHPPLSKEDFARLTVDKQVAELIFQLRDQNGHQWGQPGWCDIFDMQAEGESAAHQLVKIGPAAVPQLIEALGDERFSRSVGFHRDFHFSHTVLTIGDCAQAILDRIAGRNFYRPRSTSSYMSRDEEIAATKKVAHEWWDEFQRKGEKQSLIDDISSGKLDPGPLVVKLRLLDAAAADQAVIEGARKAQEQWIVRRFIDELARLKSDDATKQLLVRMKDDGDMRIRLAAATWLLNADHPEALPFIIEEWRRLGRTDHNAVRDGVETTIRLLVASGETAAMNELVKDWDLRAVYERFEIVSVLGELLRPNANDRYDSIQMKPAEPEAKATGIKLLAHALEDIAVRDGMSGTMGNFSYSSPRICDFALWALNQIDAKAYAFSAKASRRQRDKERVTAANVWRREHQLDLLPVPVVNLPKLAESDALKISVVDVQGEGMIKGTALAQEVVALKGTHLAADTIPRLIRWFASNPTEGVRGISIEALREADLTGVEIRVKLDAGTYPTTGDWQIHHGGRFASGQLGNSSGSCSLSYARDPEYLLDFTEDIKAGLQSPAATEFEIRAGITGAR